MGVGISFLIGLKAATLFFFFTFMRNLGFKWLAIPFLYASLVSFLVSIASLPSINLPILLGKSSDGIFPIWSLIIFSPYLYFVRAFSTLRRLRSGEAPYSEICEAIYVGGWPYSPDKLPPGNSAVIDCTCELPRKTKLSGHAYLCIPTWDTRSPQPAEIESAVKWACRKRAQNSPIFIHCAHGKNKCVQGLIFYNQSLEGSLSQTFIIFLDCGTRNNARTLGQNFLQCDKLGKAAYFGHTDASPEEKETFKMLKFACITIQLVSCDDLCEGHGRSVVVMSALLVALGVADDWKNAEKLIKEKRPYIRMNALHRKALEEWSKYRLSSPKRNDEIGLGSVILPSPLQRS